MAVCSTGVESSLALSASKTQSYSCVAIFLRTDRTDPLAARGTAVGSPAFAPRPVGRMTVRLSFFLRSSSRYRGVNASPSSLEKVDMALPAVQGGSALPTKQTPAWPAPPCAARRLRQAKNEKAGFRQIGTQVLLVLG